MFLHEENEQLISNESKIKIYLLYIIFFLSIIEEIIWKRSIAGWREVCDECSTTLFNYHYMCKICGYMICIECSNEFSQLNTEKRKSKKIEI